MPSVIGVSIFHRGITNQSDQIQIKIHHHHHQQQQQHRHPPLPYFTLHPSLIRFSFVPNPMKSLALGGFVFQLIRNVLLLVGF